VVERRSLLILALIGQFTLPGLAWFTQFVPQHVSLSSRPFPAFLYTKPVDSSQGQVVISMDEDEDPDIAAMMGFGSFGGTKKRKYDQTNSPKSKIDASGANSTQLGVRMKTNPDEVSLGFDDDDVPINNPIAKVQPQSAPTTTKSKGRGKQPEPIGLAAFLAHAKQLPENPPGVEQASLPTIQDQSPQNRNNATFSYGGPSISESELHALRRGVRNEAGDMAYFLPSFVEDPWDKLEQQQRR
jgi:hypothetical protein